MFVFAIWILAGLQLDLVRYCDGQNLYPCDSSGYHDVVENTSATFHCDQYSGSVEWRYKAPNSQEVTVFSECDATQCTRPSFPAVTATFISASHSSFTTTLTSRDVRSAGGEYLCQSKSCKVHIIVPAVVSKPTSTITRTDQGYSARCNTDVTKVYSSRGQYSCGWQVGQETRSVTPNLQPSPGDTNTSDRAGSCDVTLPLPTNNGAYNCTVTVNPGNTQSSSDNIQIARPPPPELSCLNDPVPENSNISCTCHTDNIGQPGGRLRWYTGTGNNVDREVVSGAYDASSVAMTWPVTRSDDNVRMFRCVNNWAVNITSDFTVSVAYGPDSVVIEGNTTFYTDTAGSHNLTLTCQPSDVGPSSALTYAWNVACDVSSQKECTFRPRPPSSGNNGDVNRVITCTVTNTKNNNQRKQGSVTLNLKYPPPSSPQISGYVNNSILYQGDNLTMTCSVTGGDPAVTSVTLTCPGQHDNSPSTGIFSSLMITSLNASDNNLRCMCSSQWVIPNYYTLTDTRTLRVYYPPSTPVIRRMDESLFPYVEKDNVTLNCTVTSPGNPEATLSWSDSRATNDLLQLISVDKGDNLRNITCRAANNFTQHKGRELRDVFTLLVYYGPYVSFTAAGQSHCNMISTSLVCVVKEGQRVHIQTITDSNPAPGLYNWHAPPGSDLVLVGNSDLNISSINRNNSGVYHVTVDTKKPNSSNTRLPLTANHNLTVLVTYPSSSVTLVADSTNNRTVNESDTVVFDCQSGGRPTPELRLTQSDTVLQRAEGGKLSLSEVSTRLTHTITAQCHNTGLYACSAHNEVGDTKWDTARLYVNCEPRCDSTCSEEPLKIHYESKPVLFAFKFVAFPVPDDHRITFRVNGSETNITEYIKLDVTCDNTDTEYNVNCSVSVMEVTSQEAAGLYTLSVANAFGQKDFKFRLLMGGPGDPDGGPNAAAIAGGTGGSILAVGAAAVAIYKVIKQRKEAKHSKPNLPVQTRNEPAEEDVMHENIAYVSSAEEDVMHENIAYVSSGDVGKYVGGAYGNPYEDVELNSSTNATGKYVSVPGSPGAQASASVKKDPKTLDVATSDDGSNLYSTVNKGTKPPLGAQDRPGPSSSEKQRPDVKPKPAKKAKPGKLKEKPIGKKTAKRDDKQLLQAGEYGNVGMTSLTMSPHSQEGSVYENYAFEKETRNEKPCEEISSRTVNEDGLVYTTVAFTDRQLKKAAELPPEREQTEYAGIDFTRRAPPQESLK